MDKTVACFLVSAYFWGGDNVAFCTKLKSNTTAPLGLEKLANGLVFTRQNVTSCDFSVGPYLAFFRTERDTKQTICVPARGPTG